jgi:hypothetical protein
MAAPVHFQPVTLQGTRNGRGYNRPVLFSNYCLIYYRRETDFYKTIYPNPAARFPVPPQTPQRQSADSLVQLNCGLLGLDSGAGNLNTNRLLRVCPLTQAKRY